MYYMVHIYQIILGSLCYLGTVSLTLKVLNIHSWHNNLIPRAKLPWNTNSKSPQYLVGMRPKNYDSYNRSEYD